MYAVIDRFEGDYAVLELDGGGMVNVRRSSIPQDALEGDVLIANGGRYTIDRQETERRRAEIEKLTGDMWK